MMLTAKLEYCIVLQETIAGAFLRWVVRGEFSVEPINWNIRILDLSLGEKWSAFQTTYTKAKIWEKAWRNPEIESSHFCQDFRKGEGIWKIKQRLDPALIFLNQNITTFNLNIIRVIFFLHPLIKMVLC